ncbi:hypothetical protein AB0L65_22285 [Nonomuraea sp. NPDC052116]|uniref:hypothetical protein n=1 Tax=Nonomuraea sp. NPDC052116 TaxID=3155665 RepID=UPI0034266E89
MQAQGTVKDAFSAVRDEFDKGLHSDELGACVALDVNGETVVDLWGGHRDPERTSPWTRDSIVNYIGDHGCHGELMRLGEPDASVHAV